MKQVETGLEGAEDGGLKSATEGEALRVPDASDGDVEGNEEVGELETEIQRGGVGMRGQWEGPGGIKGMRKDDTLSRHRQEVVENVSFRQNQYAIRFIHEPRDLSQRTFSEVANTTFLEMIENVSSVKKAVFGAGGGMPPRVSLASERKLARRAVSGSRATGVLGTRQ